MPSGAHLRVVFAFSPFLCPYAYDSGANRIEDGARLYGSSISPNTLEGFSLAQIAQRVAYGHVLSLQDSVRAVIYGSEKRSWDATPLHTRDCPVVSRLDSSKYLDQVSNVAILSTR
jgi:hypothetical protein